MAEVNNDDGMVEVELELDDEIVEILEQMAIERGCSIDDVIRQALREVMEAEKNKETTLLEEAIEYTKQEKYDGDQE